MIRRATEDDMPRLLAMGKRFAAETDYRRFMEVDPARLAGTIFDLLNNPDGAVFVSGNDATITGMIALLLFEHPFSGERTVFELVWWVDPESRGDGVRLLRAAEEWGRESGVRKMQMVAPNDRVGALYRRLGYEAVETSYQRSL